MNELDPNSPAFQQLIVLVSDADVDISSAARRVVELATAHGGRVQILGLYQDEGREPSLRRQIGVFFWAWFFSRNCTLIMPVFGIFSIFRGWKRTVPKE